MSYHIMCSFEWDMAHRIPGHRGKCRNLHGHRYRAEVLLVSEMLTPEGFVMDFGEIKRLLGAWIDANLDHNVMYQRGDPVMEAMRDALRDIGDDGHLHSWYVLENPPTAENIAAHLDEVATQLLTTDDVSVWRVRVYETPTTYAEVP